MKSIRHIFINDDTYRMLASKYLSIDKEWASIFLNQLVVSRHPVYEIKLHICRRLFSIKG